MQKEGLITLVLENMTSYTIFRNAPLLKFIFILIIHSHLVFCDDSDPILADVSQIETWFKTNVQPLTARKGTLDPVLETAEANVTVIKVTADGTGDFKTITDAVKSVPDQNTQRVIISIGPGNYTEKVRIDRPKKFITLYGDPKNPPVLVFDGTAATYGTVDSATLIVEADYFNAVNIVVVNKAPRPDGQRNGAQAVAFRLGGSKSSVYNSKFHGFQDTLCDDIGFHFFKDCYIEGTVDFIFGNGQSLYLNTDIYVIPGDNMAMVTAQAKHIAKEPGGYSFAHGKIKGTGGIAFLGRAWMPYATVTYAFMELSDVINPKGWSDMKAGNDKTAYFGEYQCSGPGSSTDQRVPFGKKLSAEEIKPFISLSYINASSWLLPPVQI